MEEKKRGRGRPRTKPLGYKPVDGKKVAQLVIHLLDGGKAPDLQTLDALIAYAGAYQNLREQMRQVLTGEAKIV